MIMMFFFFLLEQNLYTINCLFTTGLFYFIIYHDKPRPFRMSLHWKPWGGGLVLHWKQRGVYHNS